MQTLRFLDYPIEKADLNGATPYPALSNPADLHSGQAGAFQDDGLHIGYGLVSGMFPYKPQESYGRKRSMQTVKAAILENDTMRATFLTEYGCRLWSLYDKTLGRELLHANQILQFANLAIRNAWFAGGVEWNIGMIGHTPLTCEPMFCEQVTDSETGVPVLRFYEFERIRGIIYEVDAYLSPERPQLMVRVRIKNSHDHEIPMYWWSNMAVPESLSTRVVVDADSAYGLGGGGELRRVNIPYCDGRDVSYSTNNYIATDYFFRIPEDHQRFIAAADTDGHGILQTSTHRLQGRKMFMWGMNANGRRWQDFLSKRVHPYIEIQSGLAKTQCECLPMGANEEWEWLEGYGALEADGEKIQGDWHEAIDEVKAHLVPEEVLEKELIRTRKSIVEQKGTLLQMGSGWGYVEQVRREKAGEAPLGIVFPKESVTGEEQAWLDLLTTGTMTEPADHASFGFMGQGDYLPLLEKAPDSWFTALQYGLCLFANGQMNAARAALNHSVSLKPNAYALSALSDLSAMADRREEAADLAARASLLDEDSYPLANKAMNRQIDLSPAAVIAFFDKLPEKQRQNGRLIAHWLMALLADGQFEKAEARLTQPLVIDDLREGETLLQELWHAYCVAKIAHDGITCDDQEAYIRRNMPAPAWVF